MSLFVGEYPSTIDDKNRIIIPARMRQTADKDGELGYYVTRGVDACVAIQTAPRFEQSSAESAEAAARLTAAGRLIERARFSSAEFGKCDKQGRLMIPARLLEALHIGREVTIVGVNDRIEVWDRARWDEVKQEIERRLVDDAEKFFGGPKGS